MSEKWVSDTLKKQKQEQKLATLLFNEETLEQLQSGGDEEEGVYRCFFVFSIFSPLFLFFCVVWFSFPIVILLIFPNILRDVQ